MNFDVDIKFVEKVLLKSWMVKFITGISAEHIKFCHLKFLIFL